MDILGLPIASALMLLAMLLLPLLTYLLYRVDVRRDGTPGTHRRYGKDSPNSAL